MHFRLLSPENKHKLRNYHLSMVEPYKAFIVDESNRCRPSLRWQFSGVRKVMAIVVERDRWVLDKS